jgi:predicted ATPase
VKLSDAFIRRAELQPAGDDEAKRDGYPWNLPVTAALEDGLDLHPRVTYLIGENGAGKSTLIEALAVAAGLNPEGGSRNFAHATRASHSALGDAIRLVRGTRHPKTDWFLRAESIFTAATYLEELPRESGDPLAAYGGRSLHEQSHGESFLAILTNRFGPDGLYFLDEPEAALSTQNCLTLLRRVHELTQDGAQFVIATHSPIVLSYPDATIYACQDNGIETIDYDDAQPVRLTRAFLDARERFLHDLLAD